MYVHTHIQLYTHIIVYSLTQCTMSFYTARKAGVSDPVVYVLGVMSGHRPTGHDQMLS